MPPDSLDEALDHLYSVPPESFTAERDALVKSLRSTDKEAAAAVKALRKPPVTAWALNQVARTHPDDLAALADADAALAEAQRKGGGREALASATAARRDAIRRLVEESVATLEAAGHPASPANRDRIAQTLTSLAVDEEGRGALQRGRLAGDLTPASIWETSAGHSGATGDQAGAEAGSTSRAEADGRRAAAEAERLAALADRARAHADRLAAEAARRAEEAERARIEAEEAKAEADRLEAEAQQASVAAKEAAGR